MENFEKNLKEKVKKSWSMGVWAKLFSQFSGCLKGICFENALYLITSKMQFKCHTILVSEHLEALGDI